MQIRDFTEVLEAGLSAADVAVIPPGYDSVTIGDIERTRLNHIRILFFYRCERRYYSESGKCRRNYFRIRKRTSGRKSGVSTGGKGAGIYSALLFVPQSYQTFRKIICQLCKG